MESQAVNFIGGFALAFYLTALFAILAVYAVRRMRRVGIGMVIFAALFLHSMASKPWYPSITFDDYLADNGSCYTTNSAGVVNGIDFKWKRASGRTIIPLDETLTIEESNGVWRVIGTANVSAWTWHYATSATNLKYRISHEWQPVAYWRAAVLSPTTNAATTNEWIVGKGRIERNGVEIAPKRNDE